MTDREKELKQHMWGVVPKEVQDELVLILFDNFCGKFARTEHRFFYQGFLAVHGLVKGYTTREELKLTETQEQIMDLVLSFEKIDPDKYKDPDDLAFGAGAALYRGMLPRHVSVG